MVPTAEKIIPIHAGAMGAAFEEYSLIGAVLDAPDQWSDVTDIQPGLFGNPTYRAVWAVIYDRQGQIAPAVLFNQLLKRSEGERALDDLGGMDGIHRLYRDGKHAGPANVLADEIRRQSVQRDIELAKSRIRPESYRDPADYGIALSAAINNAVGKLASPHHGTLGDAVDEALSAWQWRQDNPGKVQGIRTGIEPYDKAVGGYSPGQMILIPGHSGEGKSQLMCYLSLQAALRPHDVSGELNQVAFFSLEMEARELSGRWLANLSRVNMQNDYSSPDEARRMKEGAQRLKELGTVLRVIPASQAHTIDQICRTLRQYKTNYNIDLAVIDYAQLVGVPGRGDAGRYEQMAEVARRLKVTAQELGVAIVMGCQLNREALSKSTGGKPGIHHVADSMDLVRSSDVVTMFWDPSRHIAGEKVAVWEKKGVLLTPKIRHRATPRNFVVKYEREFTNFETLPMKLELELLKEIPIISGEDKQSRAAAKSQTP